MNTPFELGTSAEGTRSPFQVGADAVVKRFAPLFFAMTLSAGVTGCSFLKPAQPSARHFVLSSLPATEPAQPAPSAPVVGVGPLKLPAYLFDTSLAVRKGSNEIEYLPSALWAERLDTGFQRVLAANLATLIPTDQVRLSAWRPEDVAAEVHVTLEQFDVNAGGEGVLIGQWRILLPGGGKVLRAGGSRLSRQGPPPYAGASGAVATLSDLLADLSRQVAQDIREATSGLAALKQHE